MSTIRQQNELNVYFDEEDDCISISMFNPNGPVETVSFRIEHAKTVIKAIREEVRVAKEGAVN